MFHRVLEVRSSRREELRDVTAEVYAAVRESNIDAGIVTVFVPHTTAAVTLNENADPDVQTDMLGWLARLVPVDAPFRHAEGNSDAHPEGVAVGTLSANTAHFRPPAAWDVARHLLLRVRWPQAA